RGGFYGYLDRAYASMLRWSMAHRLLVASVAFVIAVSSIPLYSLVRQEFVPSGVDEGEFEVGVTAPEGLSLGAMNEALVAVEREIRGVRGVTLVRERGGGA